MAPTIWEQLAPPWPWEEHLSPLDDAEWRALAADATAATREAASICLEQLGRLVAN